MAALGCRHHPVRSLARDPGYPLARQNGTAARQNRFHIRDDVDSDGERTSSLSIADVREEDSGQFKCAAENTAGRAEANFTLQVR